MPTLLLWVKVSRPKTLIASVAPILVAVKNFSDNHEVNDLSLIVLLGCLLFITPVQISTNLANDYFPDWKRGADSFRGNAPERLVTTGKIEGKSINRGIYSTYPFFLGGCSYLIHFLFQSIWFLPLEFCALHLRSYTLLVHTL